MHYFLQSSIFCVHPSAAAGLRQAFVNDRNGEILLYVTLPCIKETVRFQAGSRARSRLYRSQILQVNMRWKALAEIYTMHSFAPFSMLKIFVKNR